MKNYICLLIVLVSLNFYAQDFSSNWQSHFSYNSITDVSQSQNKVYVASDNVVFIYDVNTREIEKLTSVEGLSAEIISAIHYSEAYEALIIGYENGLINVYQDGEVLTVVDILDKQTIPPNSKRINQFNEYDNVVYIATDYGISVYNMERLEFGDTYFIGNGGSQIVVKQTAVFNGHIYAACNIGNGVIRAEVDNANLIDFNNWTQIFTGGFVGVQSIGSKLYVLDVSNNMHELQNNNTLNNVASYASLPVGLKTSNDRVIVVTTSNVYVYSEDFSLLEQLGELPDYDSDYSSATVIGNAIYVGTTNNLSEGKPGFGILKVNTNNSEDVEAIVPDGPLLNEIVSVTALNDQLWMTFGGFSYTYNFSAGNRRTGLSHWKNEQWVNIPYDTLNVALMPENPYYLSDVSINPFNPSQVFVASFWSGFIELNNTEVTQIYNEDNSLIGELDGTYNQSIYSKFDSEGTLWAVTGRVEKPLTSFRDGQWQAYDFSEAIDDPTSNFGFAGIEILLDQERVFLGAYNRGLIGYNLATGEVKAIYDEVVANLPSTGVYSLALDRSNHLWIGTNKGLRVLYNTSNFFESDNVRTEAIIFLEDGIPKELLEQQFVSDIEVDGSNNKWVATIGAGAFYFSSDGQETIYQFTTDTSPLPSNNISDIALDSQNGIVYFATDKGMVSFKAGSSNPQETLENAHVFPNPVRPDFDIVENKIKIKDISENCNIKITDIEGNLVAEAQSNTNLRFRGYNLEVDGGTVYWNGKNMANNVVASGVYLVMLTDLDTQETKVLKLMIVR